MNPTRPCNRDRRRGGRRIGLAVLAVLSALVPSSGAEEDGRLPRDLTRYSFKAMGDALRRQVADGAVDGMALIIVKDGKVVYEEAFGSQALDVVLPIASATKLPTVTAFMTLVDRGKISLDDPVGRYLPYWPEDKAAMKVRHLLSCMSGLPSRSRAYGDRSITLDEAARIIAQVPLAGPPGEQLLYGGNGFQVAARVAEVASGQPWHEFFRDALARPLGFTGFSYQTGTENPWVAGGAVSNLEDYAKLLCVHLNRGRFGSEQILSPEAVAAMQEDQVGSKRIAFSAYRDGRHYGLSWWITRPEEAPGEFSDQGAFGATPVIDTRHGYGAFLLMKKDVPTALRIWRSIRPLVNAAFESVDGMPVVQGQ